MERVRLDSESSSVSGRSQHRPHQPSSLRSEPIEEHAPGLLPTNLTGKFKRVVRKGKLKQTGAEPEPHSFSATADRPKKAVGKLKSLDLRRYTPKRLFAPFTGSHGSTLTRPSSASSSTKVPFTLSRSNTKRSGSLRSLNQNLASPIMDASLVKSLMTHIFELTELDPLFRPIGKVKLKINESGVVTCEDGNDTYIEYDTFANLFILDIGKLLERPGVFQVQSTLKGTKAYEATSVQEKLDFIAIMEYLRKNETLDPESPLRESTPITHSEGTESSADEDEMGFDETAQFDYMKNLEVDDAPTLFCSWKRSHDEEFSTMHVGMEQKQKDLSNLVTHLELLRTNVGALSKDVEYHLNRSSKDQNEAGERSAEADDLLKQIEKLKSDITERKHREVTEEFPRMLDELESKINLWEKKENMKYRSLAAITVVALLVTFIGLKVTWWLFSKITS